MADAAVTFLLEQLASLLSSQVKLVVEVKEGVQDVRAKLRLWNSILKDLDGRKNKNKRTKKWEIDVRDVVCGLEDVLDILHITAKSRRAMGITKRVFSSFRVFNELIANKKKVEEILSSVAKLESSLRGSNNFGGERSSSVDGILEWLKSSQEKGSPSWLEDLHTEVSVENIVLMEDDTNHLVNQIVHEAQSIICIYGAAGIGKTSFGVSLYHHGQVRNHFESFAWINTMQSISRRKIFQDIMKQLSSEPVTDKRITGPEEMLASQFCQVLQLKKCFVVLDDILSLDALKFVFSSFPFGETQSKILITTPEREVAEYVAGDDKNGIIHSMKPLHLQDSCRLFWQHAFPGDQAYNHEFEEMGNEIVKQCKGVAAYIVSIGEFLATKRSLQQWRVLLQASKSIQPIITSSYDSLPYHLKPCFLYFGQFSKGLEVEVENLYMLWIAEGIISPEDCESNETMIDVAERYLSELVESKLVTVQEEEDQSLRKYRSCRVHDLIHDLCLVKGKDYFFEVLDFRQEIQGEEAFSSLKKARRLVLYLSSEDNEYVQLSDQVPKNLRSLLLVNSNDLHLQWPQGIDLSNFQLLRVLIFELIDFQERQLPTGIRKLFHLRYLGFRGCILKELPASISNLSSLSILDLRVSNPIVIPNVLHKMRRLKHLYLPSEFHTPIKDKLHLGSLKELETLVNFHNRLCNTADLSEMKNLLHLSVTVEGSLKDLELIVHSLNMAPGHASFLHHSVKVKNFDCYTEERHCVFRKLLDCRTLHTLHMEGHLRYLPSHDKITSSLTEIILKGTRLKEDPMTTFEKLPKLVVLALQDNAFVGKEMKCSVPGFMELKRLELSGLLFLESWAVKNGAMPKISIVTVRNCSKLQMVINGLMSRDPPVKFEVDN